MANEKVKHTRSVYTILAVFSDFGGFLQIYTVLFSIFLNYFNNKQLTGKLIRSLYYLENYDQEGSSSHRFKPIKFSMVHKL